MIVDETMLHVYINNEIDVVDESDESYDIKRVVTW